MAVNGYWFSGTVYYAVSFFFLGFFGFPFSGWNLGYFFGLVSLFLPLILSRPLSFFEPNVLFFSYSYGFHLTGLSALLLLFFELLGFSFFLLSHS